MSQPRVSLGGGATLLDVAKGESTVQLPRVPSQPLEAITFARVGEGKTALRAIFQSARALLPPRLQGPSPDDLPLPHRLQIRDGVRGNLSAHGLPTWGVFFSDSAGQVEVVYHLKGA